MFFSESSPRRSSYPECTLYKDERYQGLKASVYPFFVSTRAENPIGVEKDFEMSIFLLRKKTDLNILTILQQPEKNLKTQYAEIQHIARTQTGTLKGSDLPFAQILDKAKNRFSKAEHQCGNRYLTFHACLLSPDFNLLVNPNIQCLEESRCVSCVNAITDAQRPAAVFVTKDRPIPESALSMQVPMMDNLNFVNCSSQSGVPLVRSDPMQGVQRAAQEGRSQRQAQRRLKQDQGVSTFLGRRVNFYMRVKKPTEGIPLIEYIFSFLPLHDPPPPFSPSCDDLIIRNNLSCGYGL